MLLGILAEEGDLGSVGCRAAIGHVEAEHVAIESGEAIEIAGGERRVSQRKSRCRLLFHHVRSSRSQYRRHHGSEGFLRLVDLVGSAPGDDPVRSNENAAPIADLAAADPVAVDVVGVEPERDLHARDVDAELGGDLRGGVEPRLSARTGDEGEPVVGAEVEGGDVPVADREPRVGKRAAWIRRCLVVQDGIASGLGRGRPVADDRSGPVALPELDAVGVELGIRHVERGQELGPMLLSVGAVELVESRVDLVGRHPGPEPERREPAHHLVDALVRPVDDLATDRLALGIVAVEQRVAGQASHDERELPHQVVRVLHRGVAAQPVRGRVAVGGIAGDEEPTAPVARGHDVIELPGAHLLDRELDVPVSDGSSDALDDHRLVELVGGQSGTNEDRAPLVPRLDAGPDTHQVLAARRDSDEERAGTMRGVAGQIGLDPDRDGIADPRLSLELESPVAADNRAGAVAPDRVAGDHLELGTALARAHAGRDMLVVLHDRDHLAGGRPIPAGLFLPAGRQLSETYLAAVARTQLIPPIHGDSASSGRCSQRRTVMLSVARNGPLWDLLAQNA